MSSPTPVVATTPSRSTSTRSRGSRSSSLPASCSRTTTSASACSAGSSRCCAAETWEQALVDHIAHAARSHPRRAERLRGDPLPRRRRSPRCRRGRRRDRRARSGRSRSRTNRPARCSPCGRATSSDSRDAPRRRRRRRRHARPVAGCPPSAMRTNAGGAAATDRHGRRLGPRLGDHPDRDARRDRPRRRHDRPVRVPARRARARHRGRDAHERRRRHGALRRCRRADPQGGRGGHAPRPPRAARRARRRGRRRRSSASTPNSTIDLVVSVDDEGRIWLDSTPKGILAEIGQTARAHRARRLQRGLAHHRRAGGRSGMHAVYAFLGDDGDGRRKYIHYGRVVARAD